MRFDTDESLKDDIFDLCEYIIIVNGSLLISLSQSLEAPLAARLFFLFFTSFVAFEVFRLFVN